MNRCRRAKDKEGKQIAFLCYSPTQIEGFQLSPPVYVILAVHPNFPETPSSLSIIHRKSLRTFGCARHPWATLPTIRLIAETEVGIQDDRDLLHGQTVSAANFWLTVSSSFS
jgi:hypothetical protein